jgi:cell division protein ZapA
MKQVEVTILGQGYLLGCPEGGEALLATAVASVDKEMGAIRDSGKVKARDRIAVLAALNLAYQLAERGPQGAPAGSAAEVTDIDLAALLRRIDNALGDDGQLL